MRIFGWSYRVIGITALVVLLSLGSLSAQTTGHTVIGKYSVTVNYDQPLTEMFDSGMYSFFDSEIISEKTSVEKKGTVTVVVEIVQFTEAIATSEMVITALQEAGYRPATIAELVVFDRSHPEVLPELLKERFVDIVAFGTQWRTEDGTLVAGAVYLNRLRIRALRSAFFDNPFPWKPSHYYFAAVRLSSGTKR